MKVSRRIASSLFALFALVYLAALSVFVLVFARPQWLLTEQNLERLLTRTAVLQAWSWESVEFEHRWIDWNERVFGVRFKNFCFKRAKEALGPAWAAAGCFEELSWKFKVLYQLGEGLQIKSLSPLTAKARRLRFDLPEKTAEKTRQAQEEAAAPDIKKWWGLFWGDLSPDLRIDLEAVEIRRGAKAVANFDLGLQKRADSLKARSLGFMVSANPSGAVLRAPKTMELPFETGILKAPRARNLKAKLEMREKNARLSAGASIYGIEVEAISEISLPLEYPPGSPEFLRRLALSAKARAKLERADEVFAAAMKEPYSTLPAPLNSMSGPVELFFAARPALQGDEVEFVLRLSSDMRGTRQELAFDAALRLIYSFKSMSAGSMFLDLNPRRIVLQLPRLPKNSLPPKLFPDGRIKQNRPAFETALEKRGEEKTPPNINMRISVKGEDIVGLRSNLIDETLRFQGELRIAKGQLESGRIRALPFRTELFKREVALEKFLVDFGGPEPMARARVLFDLPEYDVTLFLEGPLSSPRYRFESDPPLPEEDIYSVLLFGRPMIDLDGGERDAVERTNQILSQGLLSISVLYFLSGTPIQAIIYDPDSDQVTAQIAIDEKRSIQVGEDSVGVRQSLGGGWYIDTGARGEEEGYGLMLERIISY